MQENANHIKHCYEESAEAYARLLDNYLSNPGLYGEPMTREELADKDVQKHVPTINKSGIMVSTLATYSAAPLAFRTRANAQAFMADNVADLFKWMCRIDPDAHVSEIRFKHNWCDWLTPCQISPGGCVGDHDCSECRHNRGMFHGDRPASGDGPCGYGKYSTVGVGSVLCAGDWPEPDERQ